MKWNRSNCDQSSKLTVLRVSRASLTIPKLLALQNSLIGIFYLLCSSVSPQLMCIMIYDNECTIVMYGKNGKCPLHK